MHLGYFEILKFRLVAVILFKMESDVKNKPIHSLVGFIMFPKLLCYTLSGLYLGP